VTKADKVAMRPLKVVKPPKGAKYKGSRLPPTKALIDENLVMRTQRYYSFTVEEVLEVNPSFLRSLLTLAPENTIPPETRAKVLDLMKEKN